MAEPRMRGLLTRQRVWDLESVITGVLGAMLAKRLMRAAYKALRKQEPRSVFDPDSAEFSWSSFLVWAVAGGLGLGVAKLVSHRVAAVAWRMTTGTLPPTAGDGRAPA